MRYLPSPNHSERLRPVSLIVLHYTQTETLEQAVRILTAANSPKPVSSHYVVGLDGVVVQLVPEDRRAWHAGISSWRGADDVNSASIGIEIVNAGPAADGTLPPYPEAQIAAVCALCRDIQAHYAIEAVVGHSDVAPTRKRDPGPAFPWPRLAKEGIGLWTDDYADSNESVPSLLASIGYDVSNEDAALHAFRLHFYPEAILAGQTRVRERLAAVAAAFALRAVPTLRTDYTDVAAPGARPRPPRTSRTPREISSAPSRRAGFFACRNSGCLPATTPKNRKIA